MNKINPFIIMASIFGIVISLLVTNNLTSLIVSTIALMIGYNAEVTDSYNPLVWIKNILTIK